MPTDSEIFLATLSIWDFQDVQCSSSITPRNKTSSTRPVSLKEKCKSSQIKFDSFSLFYVYSREWKFKCGKS